LSRPLSVQLSAFDMEELTFSLHALNLGLAVGPAVVYAWASTNPDSVKGRPCVPLPLATRRVRRHRLCVAHIVKLFVVEVFVVVDRFGERNFEDVFLVGRVQPATMSIGNLEVPGSGFDEYRVS
jgi:hypothetical protein